MDLRKILKIKELRLKLIIIALLSLSLILGLLFTNERVVERVLNEKLFKSDFKNVEKIETKDEGVLEKINGKWTLLLGERQVEANSKKIESLLSDLRDLKKNELITNNPEYFSKFNIDEKPSYIFYDAEGREIERIYLGGEDSSNINLINLKKANDEVFRTRNIFVTYRGNGKNTWINGKILEPSLSLKSLNFTLAKNLKEKDDIYIKEDYKLKVEDNKYILNESEVNNLTDALSLISNFEVDGILDDDVKTNSKYSLIYKIEILWSNNSITKLEVWEDGTNDIFIQKDNDLTYRINRWAFFDVFNLKEKAKGEKNNA